MGGGPAGVAAALAAGRDGARVCLWERYGCLGGLASAGMVGTLCGLYLRDTTASEPHLVAGGFLAEFTRAIAESQPLRLANGLWILPCRAWTFERCAARLLTSLNNVTPTFHTTVTGVQVDEGVIRSVTAFAWNELITVHPRCVVDCTGEAAVAALAGAATENACASQVPALVFTMDGAEEGFAEAGMLEVLLTLHRAVEDGRLPPGSDALSLVPGFKPGDPVSFKLNLPPITPEQPTWRQVSASELQGRELVWTISRLLRDNARHFRRARVSNIAMQLGVRAGRRLCGKALLEERDVLEARKHPEGVARGCWPIEQWTGGSRPSLRLFPEKEYYDIPLDCLCSADVANLLVAGRCLSATPAALASARVIGTALSSGWAAGRAASGQASARRLPELIEDIRQELS